MTIHTKEPGSGGRKNPHYYLNIISKHAVAFCEWIYDNVPTELMLLRKALVYEYWKRSQRQRDFSELAGEKNSFARVSASRSVAAWAFCAIASSIS